MNRTLRIWWTTGLAAVVAALYGWVGLAGYGPVRILGVVGAVLIAIALAVASRSWPAAAVLLVLGSVPMVIVAWWSVAAPLLGVLAVSLGWVAIRARSARAA